MLKLLAVLGIVAFGAYVVYGVREARQEREARDLVDAQREQTVQNTLASLVSRHGARADWEYRLTGGEQSRFSPVFTAELEQLWLGTRPILFSGEILDIASADEHTYQVTVSEILHTSSTELRLVLRTPRGVVDSFLQQHPGVSTERWDREHIAVVARVAQIDSKEERTSDGSHMAIKSGRGELLDIASLDGLAQ